MLQNIKNAADLQCLIYCAGELERGQPDICKIHERARILELQQKQVHWPKLYAPGLSHLSVAHEMFNADSMLIRNLIFQAIPICSGVLTSLMQDILCAVNTGKSA